MTLSDKVYSALTIADEWRTGHRLWTSVVRTLYDRGWYGVAEREGKVIAYFNGVRFEL